MEKTFFLVTTIMLVATAALAHSGVKNATVKARMDAMSGIAAEMKTLGLMAKGTSAFNANQAKAAAAAIASHAANTPELFRAEEDDPKSEATPAIWTNFEDFTTKAGALEDIAGNLSMSISSSADLGPAMKSLGDTCKACHKDYRAEK